MNVLIERNIEVEAELIVDGKSYPLKHLSVTFPVPIGGMTLIPGSNCPIPANTKTLVLQIHGMDTQIPVLREKCEASLMLTDEHFHLKVPDQSHREMIAKFSLSDENHPK
jgi:hypothetical protein